MTQAQRHAAHMRQLAAAYREAARADSRASRACASHLIAAALAPLTRAVVARVFEKNSRPSQAARERRWLALRLPPCRKEPGTQGTAPGRPEARLGR